MLSQVRQSAIAPSPTIFPSATNCKTSKLGGGSIAAILLGTLVGLGAIAGIVYFLRRKRRSSTQKPSPDTTQVPDQEELSNSSAGPGQDTTFVQCAPFELSSERRTSELGPEMAAPNGGHPPPSPHAPRSPRSSSSPGRRPMSQGPHSPHSTSSPREASPLHHSRGSADGLDATVTSQSPVSPHSPTRFYTPS